MDYKCKTCKDKGYYMPDGAWNITLREYAKCPDCDIKSKDRPKDTAGLLT